MIPSLSNSQRDSLHPRTLSGDLMETCHIYNCKGTDVHIVDLIAVLNFVMCFVSFCSNPVQGIPVINWWVLHIEVRAMLIFKARIFAHRFSKLAAQNRNNIITDVLNFFCKLALDSSYLSCKVSSALPMGLYRLGMRSHTSTFTLGTPVKLTSLPLPAWTTLLRVQPMYASHWSVSTDLRFHIRYHPRDNTYRIWFQKHGPVHLVAYGRYCNSLLKCVHLDQFQKQIPKITTCLPQYINVVHAVGQQFHPTLKNCPLTPRTKPKIGLVHHLTLSVLNDKPHVPNWWLCSIIGDSTLLACELEWFGHAINARWKILKWIQKVDIRHNHTKNSATLHYQLRAHLSSRNLRRNCASYPRVLREIT